MQNVPFKFFYYFCLFLAVLYTFSIRSFTLFLCRFILATAQKRHSGYKSAFLAILEIQNKVKNLKKRLYIVLVLFLCCSQNEKSLFYEFCAVCAVCAVYTVNLYFSIVTLLFFKLAHPQGVSMCPLKSMSSKFNLVS